MNNEIQQLAQDPEYQNLDEFVSYCQDDEREEYTHVELQALALNLKTSGSKLRTLLETQHGLTLKARKAQHRIRGFTANPHDRWYGPGACKSHGGSGWQQINGFAGQKG